MNNRIEKKRQKKTASCETNQSQGIEYQSVVEGGRMLNDETIKKAIKDKEIEIAISFEKNPKSGEIAFLSNREKNLLNSSMEKNLYSDRLKITMGPIIKVLKNKPVSKKNRFKNHKYCHDLRTTNNKYIINPGESVIILTNERIRLSGRYACLVLPRISLSDVGIVVSTAYVDPYYNGVMRLHLSNLSDKSYELSFLEPIAQCFFFELSGTVADSYKDQFSTKSVFFGHTWKGILESDMDPFPTKKTYTEIDGLENIKKQLGFIWEFIKEKGLILALVANVFVIVSGAAIINQRMNNYSHILEVVQQEGTPQSCEIKIKKDELYGEKSVVYSYPKEEIVSVLCNNDNIHYVIESGNTPEESNITFSCSLDIAANRDTVIDFSYVILRRK